MAGIMSELGGSFLMTIIHAKNAWPFRPWVVFGAFRRWLWQQFKINHASAAMSDACSNAVSTGITTADHNHILAFCTDEVVANRITMNNLLCISRQKVHRKRNTVGFPVG